MTRGVRPERLFELPNDLAFDRCDELVRRDRETCRIQSTREKQHQDDEGRRNLKPKGKSTYAPIHAAHLAAARPETDEAWGSREVEEVRAER